MSSEKYKLIHEVHCNTIPNYSESGYHAMGSCVQMLECCKVIYLISIMWTFKMKPPYDVFKAYKFKPVLFTLS